MKFNFSTFGIVGPFLNRFFMWDLYLKRIFFIKIKHLGKTLNLKDFIAVGI